MSMAVYSRVNWDDTRTNRRNNRDLVQKGRQTVLWVIFDDRLCQSVGQIYELILHSICTRHRAERTRRRFSSGSGWARCPSGWRCRRCWRRRRPTWWGRGTGPAAPSAQRCQWRAATGEPSRPRPPSARPNCGTQRGMTRRRPTSNLLVRRLITTVWRVAMQL